MALIAKVEGNGVVLYEAVGNRRGMKITGWPDAERVTGAMVSGDQLTVNFSNGKVRVYDAESGQSMGTY